MSESLIERCFRGGVGREAVFEGAEVLGGSGVGGDEGQAADGDGGFEQGLGGEDGADGVGLEVVLEVGEGPGPASDEVRGVFGWR